MRRYAHAHMPVDECRLTFGVKGQEICGCPDLAGRVVRARCDMFEKAVHEGAARSSDIRATDSCCRQCASDCCDRHIVQSIELFRAASPIRIQVGLVPNLEVPALHFFAPVPRDVV
jgi:hypothetical protein